MQLWIESVGQEKLYGALAVAYIRCLVMARVLEDVVEVCWHIVEGQLMEGEVPELSLRILILQVDFRLEGASIVRYPNVITIVC